MRIKHFLAAGAFALAAVAAWPAAAQSCAGFVDVDAASAFCPSVEWIKNRAITTGCNPPTNDAYCPDFVVTRLAMAAFMKRLGDALTPTFSRKKLNPAPATLNFIGQQNLCATDAVAITGYPRTAIVRGLVNLFTPNGGMDIKTWVVVSTDAGATWNTPGTQDGLAYGSLYSGLTPPSDISLHPMNVIDLTPGSSYQFALAAIRVAGSGDVANVYCENLVQFVNRQGTSTPFDASTASGPHGRGD